MSTFDALDQGRESFELQAWAEAFAQLSVADRDTSLEPDDLVRLATAAYLLGRDDESVALWERAHHGFLSRDEEDAPGWDGGGRLLTCVR